MDIWRVRGGAIGVKSALCHPNGRGHRTMLPSGSRNWRKGSAGGKRFRGRRTALAPGSPRVPGASSVGCRKRPAPSLSSPQPMTCPSCRLEMLRKRAGSGSKLMFVDLPNQNEEASNMGHSNPANTDAILPTLTWYAIGPGYRRVDREQRSRRVFTDAVHTWPLTPIGSLEIWTWHRFLRNSCRCQN